MAEAVIAVTAEIAATVDHDPLSEEKKAPFVKIGHKALNTKIVLSPPRQGSIVHHLTVAHREEVTHLLTMIG